MLIVIGYVIYILFIAFIFFLRIRKNMFSSYLTEHVGLLASVILVSSIVEVNIVIKAVSVVVILLAFIYGRSAT